MEQTNYTDNPTPSYTTSVATTPKKPANKWLFIFIVLLLLGAVGAFMLTRSGGVSQPTATPSFGVIPVDDIPTGTPTPTPAPVNKSEVKIEIKNGTGITGEAGFLQTKLKALGYSDISAGNADSTDYTDTTVTFAKDLSTTVQDEIKKELEGIYNKVVAKTSSTQSSDIVIITGTRSGATSKPAGTTKATSKASATPTSTSKASGSPTATPTKSPTPTPIGN